MQAHDADEIGYTPNFVNLVMNRMHLMLPQSAIHSLETIADMHPPALAANGSVGRFEKSDEAWPMYVLSVDLAPQPEIPEDYRTAVLMKNGNTPFGLLCQQVYLIERSRIAIHPVPACMRNPQAPLLALYGEEVRMVSSAKALSHLILLAGIGFYTTQIGSILLT